MAQFSQEKDHDNLNKQPMNVCEENQNAVVGSKVVVKVLLNSSVEEIIHEDGDSKWEEEVQSGGEELGDYNDKEFETTISKITRPNIKPKGRRGHKSNKDKLEMPVMVLVLTKITIGKGISLPQGQCGSQLGMLEA